ncbi:RING zinc finger protein, putative [Plasmodium vivax]|uniref:RING zinc finger protein, putative n=1 Tax=Plasmodium vivax TaxID=5855 RepID=A0A564ZQU3_PLAVI|nr:RING zinc finger protein, putative [Plasmodium vivax]
MRELPRPYPRRTANSGQSSSLVATMSEMQTDADYMQQLRWNIKTKVDILMSKLFPITKKIEEKRFIVIIEKKKNYDNFRCPICMLILYKPVRTKCGHMFCKECIDSVLKKFDYCPMCRENIKDFKLAHVRNSCLGKEYTDIKIRCWRCKEVTDIEHYEAHLQRHLDDGDGGRNSFWGGSGVPTCLVTGATPGSASCLGATLQGDSTDPLLRALSPFLNKRMNVANRDEFVEAVRENHLNTDIHSVHLLFGKRAEREPPNGREPGLRSSYGSQSGNPKICRSRNPSEEHCEMISMDHITWDAFILVQIKREKKKQRCKVDVPNDDKAYSSVLPPPTGDLKGEDKWEDSPPDRKDRPTQLSRRDVLYTSDSFEAYQKRKLKKNKTNRYFYVLLEYNTRGLFFTPMKNIPLFKDMHMERSVTYRRTDRSAGRSADKRGEAHDVGGGKGDPPAPDEQLIDVLVQLNEKVKSKAYHKYRYNAVHLFHEFANWYCSNERGDTQMAVKRTHFKNPHLEDPELMLLLFYLKYECTMPGNVDYGAMYSCANFLSKLMSPSKEAHQAVFVTGVYTYKESTPPRGKRRPGGEHTRKSNSLAGVSNISLRKADINVHFVLRVRRGRQQARLAARIASGVGAEAEANQHQVTAQPNGHLHHCDDAADVCYLQLSYSETGFQWDVSESLEFLKAKKNVPYKEMSVFFSIDRLILCLFNVRRKKYSPLFWNSAHLLQYLLHFCAD